MIEDAVRFGTAAGRGGRGVCAVDVGCVLAVDAAAALPTGYSTLYRYIQIERDQYKVHIQSIPLVADDKSPTPPGHFTTCTNIRERDGVYVCVP